ncbi:hypothetical protein BC827DRAFT_1159490 [Russula dissimulans]|nr:hypothetical protein BC827DRAFT_1159490 [Russula dissimulans]
MDLRLVPPPPSNPNPKPKPNPPNPPLGEPSDPPPNAVPPGSSPFRTPDNPYRGLVQEEVIEAHILSLIKALDFIRTPFWYSPTMALSFDGDCLGGKISPEDFNAAVKLVLTATEMGYYPKHGSVPLDPTNWQLGWKRTLRLVSEELESQSEHSTLFIHYRGHTDHVDASANKECVTYFDNKYD